MSEFITRWSQCETEVTFSVVQLVEVYKMSF